MSNPRLPIVAIVTSVLVASGVLTYYTSSRDALVVYCAHDAIYSEQLLRQFESQSGIPVVIRFDTEGTKSLGLVQLLLHERANSRCDVFWNNELLGMEDLKDAGILEPYRGPGFARFPDNCRDPEGYWCGFAGRLRVMIVNVDRVEPDPEMVERLCDESPERMVIAEPLYGTTRTHFTLLWNRWGEQRLHAWHRDLVQRGLLEVPGNAMVKNLVAAGKRDVGWTDTDDFFVAKDAGKPVDLLPVRLDTGETICIPNTVAIVKGTSKLEAAQRLVEFLLSAETELALAKSRSRQIPLGTLSDSERAHIPGEVQPLQCWAAESCELRLPTSVRQASLQWLQQEYLQ